MIVIIIKMVMKDNVYHKKQNHVTNNINIYIITKIMHLMNANKHVIVI